ncbi:exopolyphosphatase/guanosine-5'-triphosphate,3'-diphosphate pyrophosphatase [Aestuariispira insulae]|uniref:Exopolyphosphatase/guanosine-5'-triphosphate, 3'-diphosphate pyrophosphatase n=2 Tax=Aestuariispira insulae TaxID=1461337 RepID=A0A3D9HVI8_9PROT|nr:exopolyphosphatase/guanosine-5'-triphosphate,3'-diphosphate pyrophosphatase [Aestuariispira insulae]
MPSTGRWAHTYAALDLGTHNCRLLVARPTAGSFRVIDSFSRVVRLGEGVGQTGRLSEAAQLRAIKTLGACAAKMKKRGVDRFRAIATQACRLATNQQQFLDRVLDETGLLLEVIDPVEEARLAISGCVPLLNRRDDYALIFDIGGGSTQVIFLDAKAEIPSIIDSLSIPYGVVTLGEKIGPGELGQQAYDQWVMSVADAFSDFCKRNDISDRIEQGRVQMVGTSGTVTTLSGIHQALPRYNRADVDGSRLSFEAAQAISDRLRQMPLDERIKHPCIGRDRADLVLAGCIIFSAICKCWPVGSLSVADRGIREGILQDLMFEADRESRKKYHGQ